MKILLPVKRVVDYNVKVRAKSDGSGVDIANLKMSMNPFDEIAVEEGLRLKERHGGEVVVASIGGEKSVTEIRAALARALFGMDLRPITPGLAKQWNLAVDSGLALAGEGLLAGKAPQPVSAADLEQSGAGPQYSFFIEHCKLCDRLTDNAAQ